MAYSYVVYTGNGSTTQFTVSFPYIRREHVFVSVNYVSASFTWINNSTVQVSPAPADAARVEIRRRTPVNAPLVDFTDGSTLVAADLDTNALQQTYINQEQDDQFSDGVFTNAQGLPDAGGKRITNVADPTVAQDAATKNYVDSWFNTYGENYLGAYVSDPATKPSGGALVTGNLYFNTGTGRLRVYGNGAWSDGAAPTTLFRWKKTAVGGETSLSGNDDNTVPLAYVADYEQIYVNGALLARGVDYVAINGTTITGLTALTAGDVVEVLSFNAFTIGTVPTEVNFTAMPAATQPIADSDLFLVRQGTTNKKVTASIFRTELAAGAQAAQAAAELAEANAELAEANAELAEANAETAQAAAELARNQAQVARDDALLNANIYATVAAGLAATAVGNYFKTYSGNTNDFLDLYRVDAGPVATLVATYPSRAFFSFFNVDPAYDDAYYAAWVDSTDRFAFGIKPSGVVRIEKGEIGALTATSITAPGGSIDLDSIDTPLVNVAAGGALGGSANYDDFYALVETDSLDRVTRAVTSDGTQYLPKAQIDAATIKLLNVEAFSGTIPQYSAIHGAPGTFVVELLSNNYQIVRYSNGTRTQLTTSGNNYAPSLTAESPQRILYASTRRFTTPTYEVMKSDGTEPGLAVPPKSLVVWGDSMTAFLSGGSWLASKLGDGRAIRFKGVGGQTSVQIAARQGGATVTGNVSGGEIPASGAVSITDMYPTPTTSQGGNGTFRINGVVGTLAYNGGSPTFTRSGAGSAVPVTNPATIVPVLDDETGGVAYDLNEYTAILWLGRNGVGGSFGETDVSVYTGVINKIRNLDKRIVILPIFNGGGETSGSSTYSSIMARNSAIQSAFSQYWYDIRAPLIAQSKTWLQTNYNSYYLSSWGSGDTDIANDVPPAALRQDGIHLNDYGNELLAELLAARLLSLGW